MIFLAQKHGVSFAIANLYHVQQPMVRLNGKTRSKFSSSSLAMNGLEHHTEYTWILSLPWKLPQPKATVHKIPSTTVPFFGFALFCFVSGPIFNYGLKWGDFSAWRHQLLVCCPQKARLLLNPIWTVARPPTHATPRSKLYTLLFPSLIKYLLSTLAQVALGTLGE